MKLILFIKKHKKFFTALFILAIILPAAALLTLRPDSEKTACGMRFYAFDVGQGDSFLFMLPTGETILIDAGPEDSAKKLVRELKQLEIKKIDLLVATHPHSDHIGGMKKVLSNFMIGKVWDSGYIHGSPLQKSFYVNIQKKNIPFGRPKRGYNEMIGGALIEVLAPVRLLRGTRSDANNNCLVLKVTYGKTSFLMLADMEREERSTIGSLPKATVLKVSHHGSSNGTDMSLLQEVRPIVAVLSYGKNNSYGYPHREVTRAVSALGIIRLDTKNGTLNIISDGERITWTRGREGAKNGG